MVCFQKDLELYVHLVHCSDAAENDTLTPTHTHTHTHTHTRINQKNVLFAQWHCPPQNSKCYSRHNSQFPQRDRERLGRSVAASYYHITHIL